MSKKVTLPSGATVTFRDPSELRVKDRKRVMQVIDETPGGELTKAMAMTDALAAILIEDWSFDLLIPSVKIDALGELTMSDYDAILEHTTEASNTFFPQLAKTEVTEKDPKAPTDNLSA